MQAKVVIASIALGQRQRDGHLRPQDASSCSKYRILGRPQATEHLLLS